MKNGNRFPFAIVLPLASHRIAGIGVGAYHAHRFTQTVERQGENRRAMEAMEDRVKQVESALDESQRTIDIRAPWKLYFSSCHPNSRPSMPIQRNSVNQTRLNVDAALPYELRLKDFEIAMQDVYDFFHDVNVGLTQRGLERLDDFLRPAIMSGLISDMLTASPGKHSRTLVENRFHNGHPDLVVNGVYAGNSALAGSEGVEIKTTRKVGGAVDTHGARDQWMCVFVYGVDTETEPARDRGPMTFTEVYLCKVSVADFRKNARGALGTRTATLHAAGIRALRKNWIYKLKE